MHNWSIYPLKTDLPSGRPDPERLKSVLNEQTGKEWKMERMIREQRRVWFFCTSGEHLLIVLHLNDRMSAFLLTSEIERDTGRTGGPAGTSPPEQHCKAQAPPGVDS